VNILIVKLSAVGDVVHTLPSLSALREAYPAAHITWVVEEGAADLLHNHPDCDRVLVSFRKRWVNSLIRGRNRRETIGEIRSFLSVLRDRHYDLAIDFHGLFKSAVIIGWSRADRKLGYRSMQELSRFFYNETIPEDMEKHAVLRYLDFIEHIGAKPREPRFSLALDEPGHNWIAGLLEQHGIGNGAPFIALSPVAFWETKLWDNDRFARLGDRIVEELKLPVVFTGAPGSGLICRIRGAMNADSITLEGQTSLRELACLYSRAALVVTTDSGPMHIAAAVGTPTVALFGPTDPARTGPFGTGHVIIRSNISCSPCFLKHCTGRDCMMDIDVEEVFEAVKQQLSRKETQPWQ
jgi:3-deoxy-D-manno-octulosonic-acid transferase/heptosyltransferase-1